MTFFKGGCPGVDGSTGTPSQAEAVVSCGGRMEGRKEVKGNKEGGGRFLRWGKDGKEGRKLKERS